MANGRSSSLRSRIKAISHHQDMSYLADFTGLDLIGTVELKPGIRATPTHLEELVRIMKQQNARLVIREIQYDDKTALWSRSNARVWPPWRSWAGRSAIRRRILDSSSITARLVEALKS